ncbi:hypothetical protein HDU91_000949 [Kappamyces sp. JEL0680]|nr:hypothetical protein HDU91_004437 [Kappamyces sp. JEL0680]KAJ3373236.1 hypothetical protein HDU91_000949 [Kappamyces sp. JEL0680]
MVNQVGGTVLRSSSGITQSTKRVSRPENVKMTLGDTVLAFKDGEWKRESEALETTIRDLSYRNELLASQNQLLEFKLNMAMDMLSLAKLDLVQCNLEG